MAETFGKIIKGSEWFGTIGANYIGASKYPSGRAGKLQSLTAWIMGNGTAGQVRCAIYDTSLNLLTNGTTEEKDFASDEDGWITFIFSSAPSVAASTDYWLCIWANQSRHKIYDSGVLGDGFYKLWTDWESGWPSSITGETAETCQRSIYATYEEPPHWHATIL